MNRIILLPTLGACAVLLALAGGIAVQRARAPDGPSVGGPFTLTDGQGHRVTSATYQGQWRLMYFGYTHCPDACPTTLSKLGAALDKLPPPDRARIRVLFVTVDPARDTPGVVGDYAHAFGPEFTGLTGTPAELAPVEDEFHVYARRHDLAGGDYAMDHSSIIYVMGPDGGFVGLLDDGLSPDELATRLRGFGA
jgi:protein SCO1/2